MPGGHLTHGIYNLLGGEREFGPFWYEVGLPLLAMLALSFCALPLERFKALFLGTIVVSAAGTATRLIR